MSDLIDEINLSQKEKDELVKDARTWGNDWALRRARWIKVSAYKQQNLVSTMVHRGTPYNCYHEGTDRYHRKDGQPLTELDIQAIYESSPGQGSKIKGEEGDMEVLHEWFVDSSD